MAMVSFKCATCGKHVERMYMDEWIFKRSYGKQHVKTAWFCGWNCMRKWEWEQEVKKHGKRTGKDH